MQSKKIIVEDPLGIHLRPAGVLCDVAVKYESAIAFEYREGRTANAKSMLSVLAAGVKCGDEINLICIGSDEVAAMEDVSTVLINALKGSEA